MYYGKRLMEVQNMALTDYGVIERLDGQPMEEHRNTPL